MKLTISKTDARLLIMDKTTDSKPIEKTQKLPLIAVRNVVMFPSVETTLFVGRVVSKRALVYSYDKTGKLVFVVSQKKAKTEKPGIEDVYQMGVVSRIEHILQSDGHVHAVITGIQRGVIRKIEDNDGLSWAEFAFV